MTIKIRPVASNQDLRRFVLFPHALYRECPWWVPNLISDEIKLLTKGRHPFHEHADVALFLAEENGKIVGRISAHVNHNHNKFHEDRVGFFGFFDCVDSREAACALFDKAAEFVQSKDMDTLRGPMNFSTNETCGLLVNSFNEMPYIMMPYNFPYYENLLESARFTKSKDLVCYHLDESIFSFDRIGKLAQRVQERSGMALREVDMSRLKDEMKILRDIYNSAWEKNWGFIPMTDAEFDFMAHELKPVADSRLLYIAEHRGEPVGFIICLPDFNLVLKKTNGRLFPFGILKALWWKRKIRRIRIITMGIKPEHRRAGLDLVFYAKIAQVSPTIGYPEGELGWVLEDNYLMNRAAQKMGARLSKRYRIYDRKIP
ncbi:MAG TPA: N-acetyltransferase [Candidatus Sumerlaeia bacterium]|nr:N-acetyltransferase [Candidatus Sumerlaeia bacterium]